MQQLSSPIYLGLIIAALCLLTSVLIPIVIYLKQRNKKEISYEVITNVPLLNIKDEVKENFEVRFHGMPVIDATLVAVAVRNSGNVSIEEADFIDPIKLSFGDDAKIIFSAAFSEHDILSRFDSVADKGYVTYKPRLFNKGYWFEVIVMVTGFSGRVKVQGLVKGVHSIRQSDFPTLTTLSRKTMLLYLAIASEMSLIIGVIALLSLLGFFTKYPDYPASTFQLIGLIILVSLFLIGFCALEIALGMKARQSEDAFIKHIFSRVQAVLEEEPHRQTKK